ncbi:FkbM family methyltransferase [Candidatus Woesearchaeota archaeon]|jgi:FkbM family methyltransferase|nr:FkbM family methyltransferase [Candidatus Woesearchaeota archaeon]
MKKIRKSKGTLVLLRDAFDILFVYWLPQGKLKNFLRKYLMKQVGLSFYGLANKGDTILQGGCFMIETVAKWSDVVGDSGKVVIVEIDKKNVELLHYDIKRRNLNNVTIINSGVSDRSCEKELSVSESSHLSMLKNDQISSKIIKEDSFLGKKIVKVDSIDNILIKLGINKIDLACFTVSGAEREAVKGMERTIIKSVPRIWIRCSFYDKVSGNHTSEDVKNILNKHEYTTVFGKLNKNNIARNIFSYKN